MSNSLKDLHEEYQRALEDGVRTLGCVDLVGALDTLKLLPNFDLMYLNDAIENIPIKTQIESNDSDAVQKNLFRLFSAVANVPFNQRVASVIDDRALSQCLDAIDMGKDERTLLAQQIQAIKELITRPAFSLTERQARLVRQKLANLSEYRTAHQDGVWGR